MTQLFDAIIVGAGQAGRAAISDLPGFRMNPALGQAPLPQRRASVSFGPAGPQI